jgi:hypothetical protein
MIETDKELINLMLLEEHSQKIKKLQTMKVEYFNPTLFYSFVLLVVFLVIIAIFVRFF